METVQERDVEAGVQHIGEGLVHGKDLALVIEHQLQAFNEYREAQEVAGRAIGALNVLIQHLDHLIQHTNTLSRQ